MHRYSLKQWIKLTLELGKMKIAQLVTLSTMTGYILKAGTIDLHIILPVIGIFLLAAGSAALNQYQERDIDRFMKRTRTRPIPSGRVTPRQALIISFILISSGALLLYLGSNLTAMMLGLLNGFWYNGIYTPLKRKSALAVFPGALIGAVPPAVGWVAAGGQLSDPRLIALAIFFFIWQIPHFWLLLLNFGKEYEAAGFPSLTRKLSQDQLARITFAWILATASACLFIPLYGVGDSRWLLFGLVIAAIWLVKNSFKLVLPETPPAQFLFAFKHINIYILLVMGMLALDRLI